MCNSRVSSPEPRFSDPGFMQDKRRRDDFASTEVGEVKGGRVTQQAFEVADKKDSGISDAAMPGTRGDGRKDAQKNAPL